MKNEKDNIGQNQVQQPKHRLMYSEVMAMLEEAFASRNLLTKEPSMKELPIKRDNTIRVTFLKRSKKQ